MGVRITVAAGAMMIGIIMRLGLGLPICMPRCGTIVPNTILFFPIFRFFQESFTMRDGRAEQRRVIGARVRRPTKDDLISRPMRPRPLTQPPILSLVIVVIFLFLIVLLFMQMEARRRPLSSLRGFAHQTSSCHRW